MPSAKEVCARSATPLSLLVIVDHDRVAGGVRLAGEHVAGVEVGWAEREVVVHL